VNGQRDPPDDDGPRPSKVVVRDRLPCLAARPDEPHRTARMFENRGTLGDNRGTAESACGGPGSLKLGAARRRKTCRHYGPGIRMKRRGRQLGEYASISAFSTFFFSSVSFLQSRGPPRLGRPTIRELRDPQRNRLTVNTAVSQPRVPVVVNSSVCRRGGSKRTRRIDDRGAKHGRLPRTTGHEASCGRDGAALVGVPALPLVWKGTALRLNASPNDQSAIKKYRGW